MNIINMTCKAFHPCENGNTTIFVNGEWHKGKWITASGIWVKSSTEVFACITTAVVSAVGTETFCSNVPIILETVSQLAYITDEFKDVYKNDIIALYKNGCNSPEAVGVVRFGEIPGGTALHIGFYIDWLHIGKTSFRNDLLYWLNYKSDKDYIEFCGTAFDHRNINALTFTKKEN
ncbi:MAG: hypothetical protein IJ341_02745 [Bacteroidales bacterium]|nr:hypothetical protein [Bacteroidales bacterium]